MVIFLTTAVAIAANRAAGKVGKVKQGPQAPEGAPWPWAQWLSRGLPFLNASLAAASVVTQLPRAL